MDASPTNMRLTPVLLVVALVAAAWRTPRPNDPRFVVPPAMPSMERAGMRSAFVSTRISDGADSVHACSLATAPDGALLVAWFAGSREGAADVGIRMRRLAPGWCGPWLADGSGSPADDAAPARADSWESLTRQQLQRLTSRSIRKLGNPVLWFDGSSRLHMSVVSVSLGGWSGSAINDLVSDDEGRTWARARRLVLTPLFNLGTLVRTQPLVMQDGTIGLPAYHEFVRKWGMWLRLTPDGDLLESAAMRPPEGGTLQPAVAALDATNALAAMRVSSGAPRRVAWSRSADAGRHWATPAEPATNGPPNPDSSVAMIRMQDGSLLLACNPLEHGRHRLQLFRSTDDGASWKPSRTIIASDDEKDEFSYPALAQSRSGLVHLGFTHRRSSICLGTFSPEWLDGVDDGSPAMPASAPSAEATP